MSVKAKYIKDLPLKEVLDGSESLLVQDLNGTQQASLGTIVDEIKQNSQEKIREIESELNQTNTQLDTIANKGTTVEVLERVTKEEIERQIQDGTLANLTIADGSITQDKLSPDLELGVKDNSVTLRKLNADIFGIKYNVNLTGPWIGFGFRIDNPNTIDFSKGLNFEITTDRKFSSFRFEVNYETGAFVNDNFNASFEQLEDGKYRYYGSFSSFKTTPKVIGIKTDSPNNETLTGVYEEPKLIVDGKSKRITIIERSGINIIKEENGVVASKNYVKQELNNYTIKDESVGINNLTNEAKMSLMGEGNEEMQITYPFTSFQNFTKRFLVVQQKLQPCIIKNIADFKCKVLILNSIGLNAEILQIHDLDTGKDTNITVANGGYIAIMKVNSNGEIDNIPYGNRNDDKPRTDLHYIEDYSNLIVGGTVNTVKMSSYYTNLNVKIEPLTIPSLKQDVIDVKKEITSNKIEAFTQLNRVISQVPSENLQTVYKQDFTSINDTWAFVNCTNLSNGGIKLTDYSKVYYSIYQAFDEWKLRAKIKIKDVNSIFGFTSVDGEWESGSILYDGTDNVIKWSDKEITSTSIPASTSTDNSDLTLELDNTYLVELQRSGLFMKFSIYDIKNAKKISFEKTHKRFHGSLAFVTTNGDVDLLELELKVALYSSCKNMFVGDSITEGLGMGTTDISKRWASLLRDNYFKGNAICCGRGWGNSANALEIVTNAYAYGYKFNYVAVMIGTNERSESGFEAWKTNIVKIYNTIKENGSTPIIITPPLGKDGITYIQQMRDFIQEKGWDTIRMDLATSVNNDGNTFNSSLSTDGTHFNENGNQAMYERALFDLEMIM